MYISAKSQEDIKIMRWLLCKSIVFIDNIMPLKGEFNIIIKRRQIDINTDPYDRNDDKKYYINSLFTIKGVVKYNFKFFEDKKPMFSGISSLIYDGNILTITFNNMTLYIKISYLDLYLKDISNPIAKIRPHSQNTWTSDTII